MKMHLACGVVLAYVLATLGAARFTASTDHTNVAPGEQVQITAELVADKEIKGISPPAVAANDAFTVAHVQQSQSQSSSIQIINGHMSQNTEIHYVFYYIIIPQKKGPFTFPALQVTVDNAPVRPNRSPSTLLPQPDRRRRGRVPMSASCFSSASRRSTWASRRC